MHSGIALTPGAALDLSNIWPLITPLVNEILKACCFNFSTSATWVNQSYRSFNSSKANAAKPITFTTFTPMERNISVLEKLGRKDPDILSFKA